MSAEDTMPQGKSSDTADLRCPLHGEMQLEMTFTVDGEDVELYRCRRSSCLNQERRVLGGDS